MIVYDRQDELRKFVSEITIVECLVEPCYFIGYELNGKIVSVSAWTHYTGKSIQMHIFVKKNCFTEFLKKSASYAFDTLKVKKVIGLVDTGNNKCMNLAIKAGFKKEYTIKDAGKIKDLAIFSMTRAQCVYVIQ